VRLEDELKQLIIDELKLEDVEAAEIADEDMLFGEGLGLDSLDAVELVVILKKKYSVDLEDMDEAREAFTSVKTLADYIRENGKTA
jgi:acyl carrier protein